MTRLNNLKIEVPWKEKEQDARRLAEDFGNSKIEWDEAFDHGYDPIMCHNVLKGYYDLFNWCKDDEEKDFLIGESWKRACFVVEDRTGQINVGRIYKMNPQLYVPISDRWKELLPSEKSKP